MKIYYFILSMFIISACTESKKTETVKTYFDVDGFFKSEIRELNKQKATLRKTLDDNGTLQEVESPQPDWFREFELFFTVDINNEKCIGKYVCDTTYKFDRDSNQTHIIKYSAKDSALDVRSLQIEFDKQNNVTTFVANLHTVVYKMKKYKYLFYIPQKEFGIKVWDDMKNPDEVGYYIVRANIYKGSNYFE